MATAEALIEKGLIDKLKELKYTYRPDIRDKAAPGKNLREKFEVLNRVSLTDSEFARLHDEVVNADVFTAAKTPRQRSTFMRKDDTPLHYTPVNTRDWCKNTFEVIHQLRINTDNGHHRLLRGLSDHNLSKGPILFNMAHRFEAVHNKK